MCQGNSQQENSPQQRERLNAEWVTVDNEICYYVLTLKLSKKMCRVDVTVLSPYTI